MKLHQLKHFAAVCEQGSFAQAATACNVSQPAISGSIAQLEADLGVTLIKRGQQGASPTVYGNRLFKTAALILNESARAKQDIAAIRKGERGNVVVGVGPIFEYVATPAVVAEYIKKRPKVSISLVSGLTSRLYERLATGELDMSISTPPRWIEPPDNIHVDVLDESHDVVVATPGHPALENGDFSTKALAQYPWVITAQVEQAAQTFFKQLATDGVSEPRTIVRTDSIPILRTMIVEAGFLCVTSRLFVQSSKSLFGVPLETIPNPNLAIPRLICLATRKDGLYGPAAKDVLNAFRKQIRRLL
jgi:DNA-binding transcriptional LysR family regulator